MILALFLAGCAPTIADLRLNDPPPAPVDTVDVSVPDSDLDTDPDAPAGPATWSVTVDAADAEAWVHLDPWEQAEVAAEGAWLVRLQRYRVALRDGAEAAWRPGADADPLDVPSEGWIVDLPDADADGEPEYALADWYAYDGTTHVLTPEDRRWWVRTPEGPTASVVFHGYYDPAGTSGFVSMTWTLLDTAGVAP